MSDLTPLEAAEKMETAGELIWKNDEVGIFKITKDDAKVFQTALYYLRKIAAGKYKPVVHAHWKEVEPGHDILFECSHCGRIISTSWGSCEDEDTHGSNGCDPTEEWLCCPTCGALMGGKDDSHE